VVSSCVTPIGKPLWIVATGVIDQPPRSALLIRLLVRTSPSPNGSMTVGAITIL
jgi:hypothetical protein